MQRRRDGWMARAAVMAVGLALTSVAPAAPSVLATTGMVADLVDRIGGECIETEALMGPGIDPHLYRAAASDVRAFQSASLIAYNGLGLEGQLDSVLRRFGERRPTLAVAEAAAAAGPVDLIQTDGDGAPDPHVWMDAALWSQAITPTVEALRQVVPDCTAGLRERASALREQLGALDAWMRASIASIPAGQRVLLTAHDAFGYYGRAYDIEVRGIQGISTTAEASVADIQANARLIAERGLPALFVESTINPRTVDAVVAAARERGAEVLIGDTLYGDALGESGTLADSLPGLLIHNTAAITRELGGERAPLPAALSDWRAPLRARHGGE
ncbi:zinc ABC transporter substrate-binding protein [Spiribacter sp. 1M153]|uniref:metal ABC transporter solute-binding protein, Zn/Mn family n=1 Tax=Spiribacter roseus TaxID=1855875 RepID=UPI00349F3170